MQEDRYLGGIAPNTQTQIKERRRYSEFIKSKKHELGINFLDTVSKDKMYGFVDEEYYLVEPNPELVSFGEYAGEIVGQNFVVSMYNMFRDYYIERSAQVGIEIPQYFPGLVVKKSYENISDNYQRYQKIVSQVLLGPLMTGRYAGQNLNFNQFVQAVNSIIFDENKKNYKICKTGYILSPYSKVHETGLYVDLAPELDTSIDYTKVEIVNDPSFQCFGEIANQFGFLIDQQCPWRLVLDLKSKPVQENILNYNFSRPFKEFYRSNYLIRTGLDDYNNLKSFYKRLYLEYWNLTQPGVELLQSVLDTYPEESWITCYLLNRLREVGFLKNADYYSSDIEPTPQKKKFLNLLTESLERYRILNNELSHVSGVISFVESTCAQILKERIENSVRQQQPPNSSIFVNPAEL